MVTSVQQCMHYAPGLLKTLNSFQTYMTKEENLSQEQPWTYE